MATFFDTFGPFKLATVEGKVEKAGFKALWLRVSETNEKLPGAVGIYVIFVSEGKRKIPVYVGKSIRSFKGRLTEDHHAFSLIQEAGYHGDLDLYLFARVSESRKKFVLPKKKYEERGDDVRARRSRLKSVDRLEFMLIGSCLSQNPNLLNKQEKAFHSGLVVPGYLNDKNLELSDAAKRFKKTIEN